MYDDKTMHVSCYLLDWNTRRPFVGNNDPEAIQSVMQAWRSGRYEYSFTLEMPKDISDVQAAERLYTRQGNNEYARKVRIDRQTMSEGDIAVVDGRVYVCAVFGFERVTGLDGEVDKRVEQSWQAWTADRAQA
jgi:hypothetical protein